MSDSASLARSSNTVNAQEVMCAACAKPFPQDALVHSGEGLICELCELDQTPTGFGKSIPTALLFAFAPFLGQYVTGDGFTNVSIGLHTNLTTVGQDHVAFVGGLISIIAGAVVLKNSKSSNDKKGLAFGAVALAFGALHVLLRSGYLI